MKKFLIAAIVALACSSAFAQFGFSIGANSRNGSVYLSVPTPVYAQPAPMVVYQQPQVIYQPVPVVITPSQAPYFDPYLHGYCGGYQGVAYAQCIDNARRQEFEANRPRYYR